jgi:hypothetical protein
VPFELPVFLFFFNLFIWFFESGSRYVVLAGLTLESAGIIAISYHAQLLLSLRALLAQIFLALMVVDFILTYSFGE